MGNSVILYELDMGIWELKKKFEYNAKTLGISTLSIANFALVPTNDETLLRMIIADNKNMIYSIDLPK